MPDRDTAAVQPCGRGELVVVATPIGNLDDISDRARTALERADLIACEDTRRTGLLLQRLEVGKRTLLSLHEHNEGRRIPEILDRLATGASVALVSDSGTPLISDPGFKLVRAATEEDIAVTATPGPSAPVLALVLSGLPPLPYTFAGFAPAKRGARSRFLERFADLDHTLVLFESPHRLVACLEDAAEILGARRAAVAREMTKLHEEVVRGRLPELATAFGERARIKGEITLVVAAASNDDGSSDR